MKLLKEKKELWILNAELGNKYRYHNIIGKSKKMQEIYHLLNKVSNSEATILFKVKTELVRKWLQRRFIIIHQEKMPFLWR